MNRVAPDRTRTGRVVRPCGAHALLLEVADPDELAAVAAALTAEPPAGVLDVVPGARTVLLDARPGTDLGRLARALEQLDPPPAARDAAHEVVLTVRYDGPDLGDVAAHTGLTSAEVVAAHTGSVWTVGFCGFVPGFAYLRGGDDRLWVPRRPNPRTRVPAGSVGLADGWTGVYPRASPGGWALIGRTDAVLFDVDRDPPALLRPGLRVRFEDARR